MKDGGPLEDAVRKTVKQLTGVYSIAILSASDPNKIVAARTGPPSVIGLGQGEYFRRQRYSRDSRAHARHVFSGRRRHRRAHSAGRARHGPGRQHDRARRAAHLLGPDHGGKGRLQAFHAEGNL